MASASSETNFYAPPKGSEPREISDDELAFISAYTNESDLNSLRQHIISIWKRSVEQFHVYRCIQQLAFLNPRIINNPIYKDMISRRDVKSVRADFHWVALCDMVSFLELGLGFPFWIAV